MGVRVLREAPQRVLAGAGCAALVGEECNGLGARRVLLLASRSLAAASPVVRDLEAALGARRAASFVGIGAHTPEEDVARAVEAARAARAEALVSVGGGAVIDGAKHVAYALSAGLEREPPPHLAVPSTLSAAEFSPLAGITRRGVKQGIADPRLVPRVALLDPLVARHTPRALWAATGVRALDHAVEGVLTNAARAAEVDEACLGAARELVAWLPRSAGDAHDLEAAERCQLAAMGSSVGILRANAARGLSHQLGKALGAGYGIPHGVTSALTLPAVLRFLAPREPEHLARIAEALGGDARPEAAAPALEGWLAKLGVERKPLRAYGVPREALPAAARYAVGSEDPEIVRLLEGLW